MYVRFPDKEKKSNPRRPASCHRLATAEPREPASVTPGRGADIANRVEKDTRRITMPMTPQENDRLTRVESGAPMGQMLRQWHWLPAVPSLSLEAGGAPIRVRLLGDNYVVFRSDDGRVACFDEQCPHRKASLAVARRSEEHTSELQSRPHLVCRLLLEKKNPHHCCRRSGALRRR